MVSKIGILVFNLLQKAGDKMGSEQAKELAKEENPRLDDYQDLPEKCNSVLEFCIKLICLMASKFILTVKNIVKIIII